MSQMVNKKTTAQGMDPEVYNEIYTYIQAMINLYCVFSREKEELLKYADLEYFEVNEQLEAVRRLFRKRFWRNYRADELSLEIQLYCKFADSLVNIGYPFKKRELKTKNEKDVNELIGIIRELANNTRVPENNGFTLNKIEELKNR